ncbi:hypothetical protein QUF54_06300, partial [Candidatus Marithioploca araucensis]|nr:hypothetical protein [Candidatus Marithioploca araucensis]
VEGRSDRVYIEALQAKRRDLFPVPQERKVAFWSINGISDLPNKLSYWKDILNNIRNEKSLWEKSILLLDRDALSNEEIDALSKSLSERYGINTIFWNAYTIESILLENLTGFCRSLAKQFCCKAEQIQQFITQSKFSEVEFFYFQKIRFERQREGRQKEFEVLNQNTLKSLSAHNKHERFIKGLRQQENQFHLFFNKDDVFDLLQVIYTEFAEKENIFLADEQRLLGVIDHIDGDFWQDSWTHILQKVYG